MALAARSVRSMPAAPAGRTARKPLAAVAAGTRQPTTNAAGGDVPDDRLLSPRQGFSKKVSALDHLEYRVWVQQMLSADNFGVLPLSAIKLQGDNPALAREPAAAITAALRHQVDLGLLVRFEHQGDEFVADPKWQDFQKVRYPRRTMYPAPPLEVLSRSTAGLFRKHHHFFAKHSGNFSGNSGKVARSARADIRLTATANGSSGSSSTEGESERKPAPPFAIDASILEALGKCRRLGAVPKLREPYWWQSEMRANSGKGIDYPAHVLEAEAYLVTCPANKYRDLAQFLHNSFRRVPKP